MWARSRLDELIRTDLDAAWRIILLLIRVASEQKRDVLDDVDVHAFDQLIRLRGAETYERILAEAGRNATIKEWIEARRTYSNVGEEWRSLLERYSEKERG